LRQVLLVDDNPLQLGIRETVLRSAGFSVAIATTAESALATLRILWDRIGVVVTDHVMPGCTGSELVRQIRAENDWVPIIALSGMPEAIGEYDGLNVVFRQKPLPPAELIALVRASMAQNPCDYGAA
jgi:DNA-binding response OmpR family regulator